MLEATTLGKIVCDILTDGYFPAIVTALVRGVTAVLSILVFADLGVRVKSSATTSPPLDTRAVQSTGSPTTEGLFPFPGIVCFVFLLLAMMAEVISWLQRASSKLSFALLCSCFN